MVCSSKVMSDIAFEWHTHKGEYEGLCTIGELIYWFVEKQFPSTFSFTRVTLHGITNSSHNNSLGTQIRLHFQEYAGSHDPYGLEVVPCPNHFPLVPFYLELTEWGPWQEHSKEQIRRDKEILARDFGINARGVFPAEGVFAPATANAIKENGLGYVLIQGLFNGSYPYNVIFHVEGLKCIPFMWLPWGNSPEETVNNVLYLANTFPKLVFASDLDIYEKREGWGADTQIMHINALADALRNSSHRVVTTAAIADEANETPNLEEFYKGFTDDPHHYTTHWMPQDNGPMGFLENLEVQNRNNAVNYIAKYLSHLKYRLENMRDGLKWRNNQGLWNWYNYLWDEWSDARENFFVAARMEFRHPCYTQYQDLSDIFHTAIDGAKEKLDYMIPSLGNLEYQVFPQDEKIAA